ncbi:lipoprotein insertase outer membrane protein LolB [Endozoicomonas sp. 8E]|uniref:lipoprotein insertase outer membrane protein LolB n=1 Tax=Endozoicomonas sp. 8E TaxID=3035692 RepID=UPI00293907B0|nr:lipoprotein insertase outer membrane protein LolB [Endozoicomonas sp. 8E]WOG29359.1 lipoprotein insertase outer membrane protein LolB [Endozoicomonas sp. 8E]
MRIPFSTSYLTDTSLTIKLAIPVIFALLLSGCATAPKPVKGLSEAQRQSLWKAHQQQLSELDYWHLTGRLGLRVPGDSGTLSLEWQQNKENYLIYLDGPLGQAVAKINGQPGSVALEASGKAYQGQSPEKLLFELTGWDLPVSLLRYWVMGLPSPDTRATIQLNNQGYPEQITQQGWQVEYLQYGDFSGITLPVRIKVRQGEVQATLFVRRWQLK